MKFYKSLQFALSLSLVVVGMALYQAWERERPSAPIVSKVTEKNVVHSDLPTAPKEESLIKEEQVVALDQKRLITIDTDVLHLNIDTNGGDIVHLSLPQYTETKDSPDGFSLFDVEKKNRYYIAQSGLMGENAPDTSKGRAHYTTSQKIYILSKDNETLSVDLAWKSKQGVSITKRFTFKRGSYLFSIQYLIDNQSHTPFHGRLYGRFKRKMEEPKSRFFGVQTFTGAAMYTPERPYQKWTFKEMKKPFQKEIPDGWAAFVEHYFLGAWIPEKGKTYFYQTEALENEMYGVGFVAPTTTVMPGQKATVSTELYAGPQLTDVLRDLRPGLELTVDYGWLWPICQPIFVALKTINHWINNWGLSIIFITILIKLLFYQLSAASYRSMNKMKKLQPRMNALKERFGDDKQKMGQAVMELYRQEKINPLGGCLPILVQIPVFIALYYVLLSSVELRHAPFMGWIQDLSAKDPYYVLPILMGITMLVQQKLSPPPPDPMQAKVMMLMPIVFTVLFLQFPAGLVLYWFVSNLLSILQQWVMMRRFS